MAKIRSRRTRPLQWSAGARTGEGNPASEKLNRGHKKPCRNSGDLLPCPARSASGDAKQPSWTRFLPNRSMVFYRPEIATAYAAQSPSRETKFLETLSKKVEGGLALRNGSPSSFFPAFEMYSEFNHLVNSIHAYTGPVCCDYSEGPSAGKWRKISIHRCSLSPCGVPPFSDN